MEFSEKNRKKVKVLSFGSKHIYVTETIRNSDNLIFVPHGYEVETFAQGVEWIGKAIVVDGEAYYSFMAKNENIETIWHKTPTAAFRAGYVRVKNSSGSVPDGLNGRLAIGLTYPAIQKEIYKNLTVKTEDVGRHIPFEEDQPNRRRKRKTISSKTQEDEVEYEEYDVPPPLEHLPPIPIPPPIFEPTMMIPPGLNIPYIVPEGLILVQPGYYIPDNLSNYQRWSAFTTPTRWYEE